MVNRPYTKFDHSSRNASRTSSWMSFLKRRTTRALPPHPLYADRVEPGERDREAVPELLLELREHALEHQHQNAPAPPPGDQFADQDACFQRLPETHRIGDQDALSGPRECLASRVELVLNEVHGCLMADMDAVVVGYGRA